ENMVLCVEGDLPPAEVAAIASELLPPAQEGRVESLFDRTPAAPPRTGVQYLRREVSMPTFRLSFPLPDRPPEDQRFEFAAELALELLAGDSADCFRQLYESGLVDSGFTWSIERYRRKAFLSFGGDSRDPEAVCAALCAAARTMLSGGVRSDDLARLKRSMLGRLLRDLDSFSVCCTRLAECTLCGQDYFRFPEILDAITEAELAPLLRAIVPEQAVLTILAPKEEAL
ncbi:MAG: insulinase family protein, partial [Oscillospiraceae bacterium]|nr:insulinase family protein [Oscillospiraceae bacterium]